jgi:DNA-binding response OmpR family regulator
MPDETIRFEDFELDPRSFELRRAGHLVKLERIPLQLLLLLAENRDRLVTREEILLAIWGGWPRLHPSSRSWVAHPWFRRVGLLFASLFSSRFRFRIP